VRRQIVMVALIVVALAVLLPFASKNPDGLQKLVADSGTKIEQAWNGLMSGYSISLVGNGYISTFLAGLFGIVAVLLATFLLGKTVAPKKKGENIKQM